MKPSHVGRKVDGNHGDCVDALRDMGAKVTSLAGVGGGVGDLLVGFRGKLMLLEVKMPGESLTPKEKTFHEDWAGYPIAIAYSPQDAIMLVERFTRRGT